MTHINLSDLVKLAVKFTNHDLHLYKIKVNSKLQLNLMYHYTLKQIFERKKYDINTIFVIDNLDVKNLEPIIKDRYIKFIYNLHQLIPSIIITQDQQTHLDPIFTNILINTSKKSRSKKVNFSKLKKFCKKYGLNDIHDVYLSDPTYQYAIST